VTEITFCKREDTVAYQRMLLPKCTVNFHKANEQMKPPDVFAELFFRIGIKIRVSGGHVTI